MELLKPHKTIRDPVQGDVLVNRLEVAIMDTRQFQRLRNHKQLGLSHMVYPGAQHSRFEHAIGTLHVASVFLEKVNTNAERYPAPPALKVPPYGELVTRTAAILHDAVNIPYGHTIEDEGLLIPKDWKHFERVQALFKNEGELFQAVENLLREESVVPETTRKQKATSLLADVRQVLTLDEKNDGQFEFAYSADIVSNTFCADLLDYLERDAYFAGTQGRFQTNRSRAISYLFIPLDGSAKNRLVVRLWHHNRFRDDVVSELFNVLRARKDLAEAVYFHHTKVCLSAMLIEAAYHSDALRKIATEGGKVDWSRVLSITDDDFFEFLESKEAGPIANRLGDDIKARRLFIPVYQVSDLESLEPHRGGGISFGGLVNSMRDKEKGAIERDQHERKLVTTCGLELGQVIVYCPDTEMNLKALKTMVLWERGDVQVLGKIPEKGIPKRREALETEHKLLWNFYVFADSRLSERQREILAAACFDEFKRDNQVERYQGKRDARGLSLDYWAEDENVPPREKAEVRARLSAGAMDSKFSSCLDDMGYSDKKIPTNEQYDKIREYMKKNPGK